MAQITEADVEAATEKMQAAKRSRGSAKSGAKVDAYLKAADELTAVRVAFRQQEEKAGRRRGFAAGDATEGSD